jgi:hypothetical protein
MPNWLMVVLAVLAPGGVLTVLLERLRRENNRDHNRNAELLKTIDRKVDGVSDRMDDHVRWHLDRKPER